MQPHGEVHRICWEMHFLHTRLTNILFAHEEVIPKSLASGLREHLLVPLAAALEQHHPPTPKPYHCIAWQRLKPLYDAFRALEAQAPDLAPMPRNVYTAIACLTRLHAVLGFGPLPLDRSYVNGFAVVLLPDPSKSRFIGWVPDQASYMLTHLLDGSFQMLPYPNGSDDGNNGDYLTVFTRRSDEAPARINLHADAILEELGYNRGERSPPEGSVVIIGPGCVGLTAEQAELVRYLHLNLLQSSGNQ